MNLPDRDKRALMIGGGLVLLIVLVGYVILPMERKWSDAHSLSVSRQAFVATLAQRVYAQEATLKQRNALVLRMGSLFGPGPLTPQASSENAAVKPSSGPADEPTPEPANTKAGQETKPQTKKPEAEDKAPETPTDKPEQPTPDKKEASKTGATASASLAGYVEQSAKQAGATIKRITPRKSSAGLKGTKYFHPVSLQVTMECTIQNLVKALNTLEKGERFVTVDQIQIRRDSGKGDRMDVTLDLRSYEAEVRSS